MPIEIKKYYRPVLMDENEGLYIDLTELWGMIEQLKVPEEEQTRPIQASSSCPINIGDTATFRAWRACYYRYGTGTSTTQESPSTDYVEVLTHIDEMEAKDIHYPNTPYYTGDTLDSFSQEGYVYSDGLRSTDDEKQVNNKNSGKTKALFRTDTNLIIYTLELPDTQIGVEASQITEMPGAMITSLNSWKTPTESFTTKYLNPTFNHDNLSNSDFDSTYFTTIQEKIIPTTYWGYCADGNSYLANFNYEDSKTTKCTIFIRYGLYNGNVYETPLEALTDGGTKYILSKLPAGHPSENAAAVVARVCSLWTNVDISTSGHYNDLYVTSVGRKSGSGSATSGNYFIGESSNVAKTITLGNNMYSKNICLFARNASGKMCWLCAMTKFSDPDNYDQDFVYFLGLTSVSNFRGSKTGFTFNKKYHQVFPGGDTSAYNSYTFGTFIRDPSHDVTTTLGGYLIQSGAADGTDDSGYHEYTSNSIQDIKNHFNVLEN